MNNYTENDTFGFGMQESSFDGVQSAVFDGNYQNSELFNTEVASAENFTAAPVAATIEPIDLTVLPSVPSVAETQILNTVPAFETPMVQQEQNLVDEPTNVENEFDQNTPVFEEPTPLVTQNSELVVNQVKENFSFEPTVNFSNEITNSVPAAIEMPVGSTTIENPVIQESTPEVQNQVFENNNQIPEPTLTTFENNAYVEPENGVQALEPTTIEELDKIAPLEPEKPKVREPISMPGENLSSLTEYKREDDVKSTNIRELFDRVGINVKEASDIFKRNTEMKDKIDTRFEELKKLQSEVSKVKKAQYDEINAYKEDVLDKLTKKKDEIEKRLNKLKEFQTSLEKEKEEFEQYRKNQKEEIERVQKEVQDAYDNRREELKRIEDVLRKQKDVLDEERNQLSLDRIQYESDKNELANNLLKFNEIVGAFTNGIDKLDKE